MSETINKFLKKKEANSPFLKLANGETVKIMLLREIKSVVKSGFGGEETEVLRLVMDVETAEGIKQKTFDNGSIKFANELAEKAVEVGSSFSITREGDGVKTRYHITGVAGKGGATASASTSTPAGV